MLREAWAELKKAKEDVMRKRTEVIQEWIDARKERGEITKCLIPHLIDI